MLNIPKNLHEDLAFLPVKKKLLTTLEDKENYIVHISALKQALDHGLKLKKVQRVIKFTQKAWMKLYIMKNTEKKNECKK